MPCRFFRTNPEHQVSTEREKSWIFDGGKISRDLVPGLNYHRDWVSFSQYFQQIRRKDPASIFVWSRMEYWTKWNRDIEREFDGAKSWSKMNESSKKVLFRFDIRETWKVRIKKKMSKREQVFVRWVDPSRSEDRRNVSYEKFVRPEK